MLRVVLKYCSKIDQKMTLKQELLKYQNCNSSNRLKIKIWGGGAIKKEIEPQCHQQALSASCAW